MDLKYNGRRIALLVGPQDDDSDAPLSELVSGIHGVARALNGPMFEQIEDSDVALLVQSLEQLTHALYTAAYATDLELERRIGEALAQPDSEAEELNKRLKERGYRLLHVHDYPGSYAVTDSSADKLLAYIASAYEIDRYLLAEEPDESAAVAAAKLGGYRSALLDQEIDVRGQTYTILAAFIELADKLESGHPARPLARAIFAALTGGMPQPQAEQADESALDTFAAVGKAVNGLDKHLDEIPGNDLTDTDLADMAEAATNIGHADSLLASIRARHGTD